MTQYRHSYFTTGDNKKLYEQEWVPEEAPVSVVLFVHGLGSHGSRLDHWAERFADRQIAFHTYDQRGHGKSDGKRGHPKNISFLVEDVGTMISRLRSRYPGIPLVLYGHSLGGVVAINYVISTTYTADALIASSPWLKLVKAPSKAELRLMQPLMTLFPGLTLSNRLDPADISTDPAEVEKYRKDPLVHDRICLGLVKSTMDAGDNALRNVYKINCPFLIMHGTGDRITSHRTSENYVMNTSDRTRLKLWPGAAHELHHEPIREDVFNYIMQWLDELGFTKSPAGT